jgi:uncharacterized protein YprB with RNaseH-like and TPR domain
LNLSPAGFIISGAGSTKREDPEAVTEDSGHDLRNELERLKKRARGVFGGRKDAGTHPGVQVPPVPEAPPAGESPPGRGGPPEPGGSVFSGIPVTDEQAFTVPPSGPIESLVPGKVVETEAGPFYRVRESAGDIWERGTATHREYINAIASSPAKLPAGCRSLQTLTSSPAGVVYLDLETTGLRNTPLFLVGLMYSEGEDLIVDQLFARDYTEERAVLSFVSGMLDPREILFTFNGNTFDIPFLADRMTFHNLPMRIPRTHVDLLPVSRSLMKGRTPNHRLQTLELYVLGRKRTGDIPGSEIPGAYHEFVRTKDARQMAAVIHHNRLDLLSMLELITVYLTNI